MSKIEAMKMIVRRPNTARASVHALVENIAVRLEDGLKALRVAFDSGKELDALLDDLKKHSGGLAEAAIHNTVADESSPSAPDLQPKANPAASTTVGGTVVNTDMSRLAAEGEAAFKAPDGTVARFPQTGD